VNGWGFAHFSTAFLANFSLGTVHLDSVLSDNLGNRKLENSFYVYFYFISGAERTSRLIVGRL
jgi:hypothetical protein